MEYPKFKKSSPYVNGEEIEAEESDQQVIEQSVNVQPLIQQSISPESSSVPISTELSSAKERLWLDLQRCFQLYIQIYQENPANEHALQEVCQTYEKLSKIYQQFHIQRWSEEQQRHMYHVFQQLISDKSRQNPTVQPMMEHSVNVQSLIQPPTSMNVWTAPTLYQQLLAYQLAQRSLVQPIAVAGLEHISQVASQRRRKSVRNDNQRLNFKMKKPRTGKKYKNYRSEDMQKAIELSLSGWTPSKAVELLDNKVPVRTLQDRLAKIRKSELGLPLVKPLGETQGELQDEPRSELQKLTR